MHSVQSDKLNDNNLVIVGMSGGVDSSVAAYLLQKEGYEVQCLFMKNWEEDDDSEYCSAEEDLKDATIICDKLNIQLHTRNFSSEYWEKVFNYFLEEYKKGRTPNPDIICNKEIKFKTFMDCAIDMGAGHIATGHYARTAYRDGYYRLLKPKDPNKDQTYFLYALNQQQLSKSLFPLENHTKSEVREIAKYLSFINSDKKDSTGICFIGERRFKDFLNRFLPAKSGDIQTTDGNIIGKHDGVMYYTIGQRQGIGIGGSKGSNGEAWYVLAKDIERNVLIVGQGHNNPLLFGKQLQAEKVNWIAEPPQQLPFKCTAKIRYRQLEQNCTITQSDNSCCEVYFDQPQRAITPGQSVVFYSEEECIGGGIIK
jgi:tRNA-specific 2-thiouridylase